MRSIVTLRAKSKIQELFSPNGPWFSPPPPAASTRVQPGPEHPSTLTVRSNLARFTGEAGDLAGARDQYAALLPVTERVLGPEHPDTLTARDNLACWTKKASRWRRFLK
jgi:hypothetical protein